MNRRDRRAQSNQPHPRSGAFEQALGLHQAGRLAEAERGYEAVLRKDPRHAPSLHLLGLARHQTGRHEQAAGLIAQAIALRPEDPALHGDLGAVLLALKRAPEALEAYQTATALKPEAPESHYNLANALAANGRAHDAVAAFERALGLRPAYVEALNNLGELLLRLGDAAGANRRLREAARLRPDLPAPLNNLGNLLSEQGDLAGAVGHYRQALRFHPDHPDALRNLAVALARQGKHADAIAQLDRVLAINPGDPIAALAQAAILTDQGMAGQALPIVLAQLERGSTAASRAQFARCVARLESIESGLSSWLCLAFEEVWDSPRQIAAAAIRALKADPALHEGLERLDQTLLLRALLRHAVVGDADLERLLTGLRAAFLKDPGGQEHLSFRVALAEQCFINDYAFAVTPEEEEAVAALCAQCREAFSKGRRIPPGWIAALASYAPLNRLEGAGSLAGQDWPAPIRALLRQQIDEPHEEVRRASELPSLTPIRDAVSQKVRRQYEESPYPRWVKTASTQPPTALPRYLRRRFPGSAYVEQDIGDKPLATLIAGCGTGQHPILTAWRYAPVDVTAIDLSRASLGYAARKAAELGLDSIRFAQADILELEGLDERFDLIESVGVLHHLKQPMDGWRRLIPALRPKGVMRIGLYSELARRGVVACRAKIAELGLGDSDREIRDFRQIVMAAPPGDPLREAMRLDDFFSLSECRDLLFHVQEHRFTIPQIRDALDALGLRFIGFEVESGVESAFRAQNASAQNANLGDLYDLALWDAFEQAHPDCFIGMYNFFAQKI